MPRGKWVAGGPSTRLRSAAPWQARLRVYAMLRRDGGCEMQVKRDCPLKTRKLRGWRFLRCGLRDARCGGRQGGQTEIEDRVLKRYGLAALAKVA